MKIIAVTSDARKPWYRLIYIQVLLAVGLGIVIGHFFPAFGKTLKPFGDGFVKLVKMVIAPIIFCTVVHGVASVQSLKKLGRVGLKTLVYFEIVSTLALIIGLTVVNVLKPGAGFNINAATLDPSIGEAYVQKGLREKGLTELKSATSLSGDNPLYLAQVDGSEAAAQFAEYILQDSFDGFGDMCFRPVAIDDEVDVFAVTGRGCEMHLVQERAAPHGDLAPQEPVIEECGHR